MGTCLQGEETGNLEHLQCLMESFSFTCPPVPKTYCTLASFGGAVLEVVPAPEGVAAAQGGASAERTPSTCPGLGEGFQNGVCWEHSLGIYLRLFPHVWPIDFLFSVLHMACPGTPCLMCQTSRGLSAPLGISRHNPEPSAPSSLPLAPPQCQAQVG